MKRIFHYFYDVKGELKKVSWPNRKHVVKLTAIVIVISAIVAAYVGTLDLAFTKLLATIVAR